MGQVAPKSFGLYSELVIMNEMCIDESVTTESFHSYRLINLFSSYSYETTRSTATLYESCRQYK